MIRDAEIEEGLKGTMDRKSLKSLLAGLERDEKIKMFNFTIEIEAESKKNEEVTLICASHFKESDAQVRSVIEQEKMKLNFKPSDTNVNTVEVAKDKAKESIEESIEEMKKMVDNKKSPMTKRYDAKYGRINGVKPKFLRTRELHKYLFYLTRDYHGCKDSNKPEFMTYLRHENIDINAQIESELENMEVYTTDLSWKTFIPPLPQHHGWSKGWCLMSDIILRMPLSLFLQLVCVNYKVEGLDAYKDHPIRKHYLVKNLPDDIKRMLLNTRKYMASIYDETKKMIYIGLAQISTEVFKDKENCFIYINTKAMLLDTTSSAKHYHLIEEKEYPRIQYDFLKIHEIEQFWYKMQLIALESNLGTHGGMDGQEVTIETTSKKPIFMELMNGCKAEDVEVRDVYETPGDQRGACGLDSSLFVHVKRNWSWVENPPSLTKTEKKPTKRKTSGIQPEVAKKPKLAKQKRILKERPKVPKKPYYDDIDKEALKLMVGQRVEWTPEEDSLLLLSKVAGTYLGQNSEQRHSMVPYIYVRDEIHARMPTLSKNKTSRACQRRINYMCRNARTVKDVSLFLTEVKSDPEILAKFPVPERGELSREENDNRLKVQFPLLLDVLEQKFKDKVSPADEAEELIPANKDEILENFDIEYAEEDMLQLNPFDFVDPQTDEEMQASVINATILSTFCCKEDKTDLSFHLHKIYSQYPDSLLRQVMTHLRKSKMVSKKKQNTKRFHKDDVPISTIPFHLSVSFLHKFISKFQTDLYRNIDKFIKKIANEQNMDFSHGPGGAAGVVTLNTMEAIKYRIQVPEQVIVLDPNLSEDNQVYKEYLENYKNLANEDWNKLKMHDVLKKDASKSAKNVEKQAPQRSDENEDLIFEEVRPEKGHLMAARSSSRLALYLNRGDSKIIENAQHTYDYFVVASCKISIQLLKDLHLAQPTIDIKPIKNLPFDEHDSDLYRLIKSKGSEGAKASDINDLNQLVNLLEKEYVLRVGIVNTRFVAQKYCKPWLLHSYDLKCKTHQWKSNVDWSQVKMVKVAIRPWVKVTGLINRRVLDFFLGSVFSHIMSYPGIKLSDIAKHFQPALQPFHTRELVEYLCQIQGVTLKKFVRKPCVTVFSKIEETPEDMIEANILDDPEDIFVDVTSDGLIRVSNYVGSSTCRIFECPCHNESNQ